MPYQLHTQYNLVLTFLHRPYLPSIQTPVSASRKSFIICVDAANRVAAIGQLYFQRTGRILPDSVFSVYVNTLLFFATITGSGLTAGFTIILL